MAVLLNIRLTAAGCSMKMIARLEADWRRSQDDLCSEPLPPPCCAEVEDGKSVGDVNVVWMAIDTF
jgi:hypothetical protein